MNEGTFFGSFCAMTLGDLETVLATILDNAFEAVADNGRISIEGTKTDDIIEIQFRDNGTGIPQEVPLEAASGTSYAWKAEWKWNRFKLMQMNC